MNDIWINFFTTFLATFFADGIIAITILFVITRPDEKNQKKERVIQALGLLQAEMETNHARARNYLQALDGQSTDLKALFPLRYTRGTWNALKESGFLPLLNDARLVYHLLRVNEAIVVADTSLHKIQVALQERKSVNSLTKAAKIDNERLIEAMDPLLTLLNNMHLPEFHGNSIFEAK